ncbi:MAG: class I SAM-dependent methyltransferase [Ignavibacteriales bacterium]|nr:class I SAM-dependent methyltransferase [Ignavibacteriales bacterium]
MKDFRKTLYERYVSTLKSDQLHRDEGRVAEFFRTYQHRFLPLLARCSAQDPILELGCGPGYFLELLRSKGFTNAEGIDISPEQIRIAVSQNLNASVMDAIEFLPRKRGAYAAIVAIDFIEHFSKDELLRLLPLVFRALKKNGLFIVQTPNGQGLFPGQVIFGDLTHVTIFAEDSLRQILEMNGFANIQFKETAPIPDTLDGKLNSVLWKVVRVLIRLVRQIEAKNSSRLWTENMIAWCSKP